MHPYLTEKLAVAHHDELLRQADGARLSARMRSRHQRERLATRLLDALADKTRPTGISRCRVV
jgi:hypothetical protein